jgi:hypothetical protein
MSIAEASITLEAYKEVDRVAKQLWEDLDDAILKPRTELRVGTLPKIQIEGVSYLRNSSSPILTISRTPFALAAKLPTPKSNHYSLNLSRLFVFSSTNLHQNSSGHFPVP